MYYFVIGFIAGAALATIFFVVKAKLNSAKNIGVFRINYEDPMKDIYSLEIESLDGIEKHRQVLLKIETIGQP